MKFSISKTKPIIAYKPVVSELGKAFRIILIYIQFHMSLTSGEVFRAKVYLLR